MANHSPLKILRAILAGILVLALFSTVEATLNIMGMPMAVHPVGDVMDFSMGSGSRRGGGDDEEDEDEGECEDEDGDSSSAMCLDVKPSAWTLSNMYRDQPLFMNFRPRTEEAMLIDNMCFTFFPLPDDQFTYVMYTSTVYRDGSNLIESDIVTDVQLGIFRAASPYCTYKDHVLGYAGCDTFVMYRCYLSNDCRNKNAMFTFGLSQSCKQISISCLQKIEDIIQGNGIPEQDYVALPMKLPTKCVFDPVCDFKGDVEVVGLSQSELVSPIIPDIFIEDEILFSPVEEVFFPEPALFAEPFYGGAPFFGYNDFYSPRPVFGRPPGFFPGPVGPGGPGRYPGFYR